MAIERNEGEELINQYFLAIGAQVEDVTTNPDYFKKDIDFIIDGVSIEVKWDTKIAETGNMFIEHTSDSDRNKSGWYEFCKADYLFYGDAQKRLFYVIALEDLRAQIKRKYYKERRAYDKKKISVGYLVPIADVIHTVL